MININDVVEEMLGLKFKLLAASDKIPSGTAVDIVAWQPNAPEVAVHYKKGALTSQLHVLKQLLTPVTTLVPGIRQYTVGLPAQRTKLSKLQQELTAQQAKLEQWNKDEGKYSKNHSYWAQQAQGIQKELKRLQDLLAASQVVLSQMLVRETMYNRFDSSVSSWVKYYNSKLSPKKDLDPNIVKSIMFRETRIGTTGQYMEPPPYVWGDEKKNPIYSRFNLMQSIDSSAHQQLLMIEEMAPAIYKKYKLNELASENRKKDKSEAQCYAWRKGAISDAMKEFFTHCDSSSKNFMGTPGRDLHMDYTFWIRTGIRWLFLKYASLDAKSRTWSEAARAFNGDGPDARAYRDEVMSRVGGKEALQVGNK